MYKPPLLLQPPGRPTCDSRHALPGIATIPSLVDTRTWNVVRSFDAGVCYGLEASMRFEIRVMMRLCSAVRSSRSPILYLLSK
jgi:hypothetical protein